MTVTGRLEAVVLDAVDIEKLSSFYTALTGWERVRNEGDWITIHTGEGQELGFQQSPEHRAPQWPGQELPQQFHLDLLVEGHAAAAARAVELGATHLADGSSWVTLADPAGHPFDLVEREGVGPVMGLYAVTLDAPDASGLAHFYAALLGAELGYDGPEGAEVSGNGHRLMFQQVEGFRPPVWQDPERPQQVHLDVLVDDLDAGEQRALELGASRIPHQGESFRVFADPAGHTFCLTV